jgi:hypothetical protein
MIQLQLINLKSRISYAIIRFQWQYHEIQNRPGMERAYSFWTSEFRFPLFSYVKSLSCKAKVGNDECIVSKIPDVVKHVAPDEKN